MDDPIDGGGSFDATGAFLGPADKNVGGRSRGVPDDGDGHGPQINDDNANIVDNQLNELPSNANTIERDDTLQVDSDRGLADALAEKVAVRECTVSGKDHLSISSDKNQEPIRLNDETIKETEFKANLEKPMAANDDISDVVKQLPTDRMQEVAEDIEKLIMDDDQVCNNAVDPLINTRLHHNSHKISGTISSTTTDTHLIDKPKEKESTDSWYYRDPQGKVQGPFTATEMLEWYRAGYFDDTLNVRRVCDRKFLELGELLKVCSGAVPFVGMSRMPPMLQATSVPSEISVNAPIQATTPIKSPNHLVHNNKLPPQSTTNPNFYDMLQPYLPLDYSKDNIF